MNSLAFVSHPSVRIKGTENSYTPTQCLYERCPVKAPHMHCPFCVKTDAYQDPVILKAHYRVKHVDKGIEFAGLKILRCCDHCEIVGIIKGEKRFKGAHWHCYRCKNGFNRRDEAIKHYKTHFRNPQTTFQIQITQDLNSPPGIKSEEQNVISQENYSFESPVQEIISPNLNQVPEHTMITNSSNGKVAKVKVKQDPDGKDNENREHEDQQTIMIIQGDHLESAFASHIINSSGEVSVLNKNLDPLVSWEIRCRMEEEEKNMYKSKAEEYKDQVEVLQQQVADLEAQLTQQTQLKLEDLADSLNLAESQKHLFSQHLAKLIQQLQQQEPVTSTAETAVVNPTEEHPLNLQGDTGTALDDHIEQGEAISAQLEPHSVVTQLSELPEDYQVLSTTPEGNIMMTRSPATSLSGAVSEESNHIILGESQATVDISSTATSESDENLYAQVPSTQDEAMMVSEVLTTAPSSADSLTGEASNGAERILGNVNSGEEGLLQVVAAADGLASLGTDVTVVASSNAQGDQNTFIMDVGEGQRIYIQQQVNAEEDGTVQQEGVTPDVSKSMEDEPLTKRVKVS